MNEAVTVLQICPNHIIIIKNIIIRLINILYIYLNTMELDYIFGYISECLTKNDRICFPLQPGSDSAYRSCVLELIRLFAGEKRE